MSIVKRCITCAHFIPTLYRSKMLPLGMCSHIAFFKSGLGDVDESGKITLDMPLTRDRPKPETVKEQFAKNNLYIDCIDIRNRLRSCSNWRSPLSLFSQVNQRFPISLKQDISQCKALTSFLTDGRPTITREVPKFQAYSLFDQSFETVDDRYLDYSPCIMCEHFRQSSAHQDGPPIPHLGTCHADSGSLMSLLSDEEQHPATYSFWTCPKFIQSQQFPDKLLRSEPDTLPVRLLSFVETNPPDISYETLIKAGRFPNAWKRRRISDADYERITTINLDTLSIAQAKEFDRPKFIRENNFQAIQKHFAQSLKHETAAEKEKDKRFSHYIEADQNKAEQS